MPDLVDSLRKALTPLKSGWEMAMEVGGEAEGGEGLEEELGLVCKMKSNF